MSESTVMRQVGLRPMVFVTLATTAQVGQVRQHLLPMGLPVRQVTSVQAELKLPVLPVVTKTNRGKLVVKSVLHAIFVPMGQ